MLFVAKVINGNGYVMLLVRMCRHKIVNMVIVTLEHMRTVKVHFSSDLNSRRLFICFFLLMFLYCPDAGFRNVLLSSLNITFLSFYCRMPRLSIIECVSIDQVMRKSLAMRRRAKCTCDQYMK